VVADRPGTGIIGSHQETDKRGGVLRRTLHDRMPLASKRPAGFEKIIPTWRHPSPPPIQFAVRRLFIRRLRIAHAAPVRHVRRLTAQRMRRSARRAALPREAAAA